MSFELENNKELEIIINTNESGINETYKFHRSSKDKNTIVIKHIKNKVETKIVVKSYYNEHNEEIYEYKITETDKTYKYFK